MDWLSPKKKTWKEKIVEQPHQLFIPFGVIVAIYVMVITFISLLGKSEIDFTLIHGIGLIYGVFTNAFLGFLYIVIPKYTNAKTIDKKHYLGVFFGYEVGLILIFMGLASLGKLIIALSLIYTSIIFFKTIKEGLAPKKSESIGLSLLILYGGLLLFIEVCTSFNLINFMFWSYLVPVVLIVALKMVPSFFAVYFKTQFPNPNDYKTYFIFVVFFLIALSYQFEINILKLVGSIVGMIFLAYEIKKANILKLSPAILWILAAGLVWAEIGFLSLFIESILDGYSLKLSTHIFGLGFVTTMLIGFGSRVTLGHAVPAQPIKADKLTIILFVLTQFIIVSRIIASVISLAGFSFWMPLLHLSATLWVVLFMVWGIKYGKILLRIN